MKSQATGGVITEKRILIGVLYSVSVLITLMGIAFVAYSLIYNVQLPVMQTSIPGAVFGAVIAYLGIRYLFSVQKLKTEVYRSNTKFSWRNFKKN